MIFYINCDWFLFTILLVYSLYTTAFECIPDHGKYKAYDVAKLYIYIIVGKWCTYMSTMWCASLMSLVDMSVKVLYILIY